MKSIGRTGDSHGHCLEMVLTVLKGINMSRGALSGLGRGVRVASMVPQECPRLLDFIPESARYYNI